MTETIGSMFVEALQRSSVVAYLLAYASGLVASLTACSYSVLPLTVAIVGAKSAQTRQRGFLLSLSYVLGLALMYTIMGALAVVAGVFFGKIQANPIVNLVVGALFVAMGLSLFGMFNLPLLTPRLVGTVRQRQRKGLLGVFTLGAVSALVTSPCSSPIVIALLGYSATSGNILMGMSLLFFFALGMGTLLLVAGASAGFLASLPQAGRWMGKINTLCGVLLVLGGVYFLINAIILWR